jgi:hypothetical protein
MGSILEDLSREEVLLLFALADEDSVFWRSALDYFAYSSEMPA